MWKIPGGEHCCSSMTDIHVRVLIAVADESSSLRVASALSQRAYGRLGALNSDECHEGRFTMSLMGWSEAYYDASTTLGAQG
jgi:hypothetical protein